jgi:hypothetical protein
MLVQVQVRLPAADQMEGLALQLALGPALVQGLDPAQSHM